MAVLFATQSTKITAQAIEQDFPEFLDQVNHLSLHTARFFNWIISSSVKFHQEHKQVSPSINLQAHSKP